MIKSALDLLLEQKEDLKASLSTFLTKYAVIKEDSHLGEWAPITPEGRPHQFALNDKYDKWLEKLSDLTGEVRDNSDAMHDNIRNNIWLSNYLFQDHNPDIVIRSSFNIIEAQFTHVAGRFSKPSGKVYLVPDTNALIRSPSIESWSFDGISEFVLLLTPTVLEELDKLKVGKDSELKKKARSLVRQLKEFFGRGNAVQGVLIVKGKISLMTITTQADEVMFNNSNPDNQILGYMSAWMQKNLSEKLALVTDDINMMNKAVILGLPYIQAPLRQEDEQEA